MSGDARPERPVVRELPRWLVYLVILGLYLTVRGYHSLDGDQCYRLPLLLHQQDPSVFDGDPFVRAFDAFNPHRGSLWVLDLITRPLGLAGGLFLAFVLTFTATCFGVDRLARAIWPSAGSQVGLVAVGLVLATKAGNIGTNHLFEAMVLDRLMAFALGWLALAALVERPRNGQWRAMAAMALAALVHPSVGLQLALVLAGSVMIWSVFGHAMEISPGTAIRGIVLLMLAVLPGLAFNLAPGSSLQGNMPAADFWLLSVELQSPQHMLPHLWRMPQWLAWTAYLVLATLALTGRDGLGATDRKPGSDPLRPNLPWPPARLRLSAVLVIIVVGLGAAWYAIEVCHHVRVTIFQPFRMATMVRGIALLFVAGRLVALWRVGGWLGRVRAILIATALAGDWLLVVVTAAELAVTAAQALRVRLPWIADKVFIDGAALAVMLALGLNFLGHHDTEYGHVPLLAALAVGLLAGTRGIVKTRGHDAGRSWAWTPARLVATVTAAWMLPLASLLAAAVPLDHEASRHPLVRGLISRCRLAAVPADDVERLGLWCREHTPVTARFIGPPGPKTFRLWSRRSVAFNRAASPYHAAGLADWFARFQDHVDFHGSPAEFVRSYVGNRHGFEARYQARTDADRAALALRQGAGFVVAAAPADREEMKSSQPATNPLELLHQEGRYAVYRVRPELLVQRQR
jgi:hypothetical protein